MTMNVSSVTIAPDTEMPLGLPNGAKFISANVSNTPNGPVVTADFLVETQRPNGSDRLILRSVGAPVSGNLEDHTPLAAVPNVGILYLRS